MIDLGLVVARFMHYAACTTLAGAAFFPFYAYVGTEPEALAQWRQKLLFWSAILALIGGLAWFVFTAANMSGALSDIANPDVVVSVMRDTNFGIVWTVRMLVAAALVAVTFLQMSSRTSFSRDRVIALLAAGLLASLAGAGHAQVEEGWLGALHVSVDAAHLLAAGAWLGGLAPLGFLLRDHAGSEAEATSFDVDGVLMRFSGMGYAAVLTLLATGLVNSWFLVGSVSNLLGTTYGQILIAKLVFFAVMLALAASKRFWLVPAMETAKMAGSNSRESGRRKLRNHVLCEQALGLLVLLSVSVLGTIQPAIGQ
jgi:putative copper resistance protein D